jgi:hypothetical protein
MSEPHGRQNGHNGGDGRLTDRADEAGLNDDVLVGVVEDEEELSWRYKSTLAPFRHTRAPDYCVLNEGEETERYTKTLEIRDWPGVPCHGFFDPLTEFSMPNVDVTISTHFTGEDERKAETDLSETASSLKDKVRSFAQNEWIPDVFVEKALQKYAEVKSVQGTVRASEYGLYSSQTFIEIRGPSPKALETAESRIRSRLQDVSADAKSLKWRHRTGYQTVAPACKNEIGGNTKMTGDGLARLIPWTARNLIERGGIELGINENTNDPIVLNLQERETGFNVGVWGTIGAGKTTTITRILMRSKLRNSEMPIVIIDPMQEYVGFTELFGGETAKIGVDTGINPMQIDPLPAAELGDVKPPREQAIGRAMAFVRSYYSYMGIPFDKKQGTWNRAIREAYERQGITDDPETHDRTNPTLRDHVFPIFGEIANEPEAFLKDMIVYEDDSSSEDGIEHKTVDLSENESSKDLLEKRANSILMDDIQPLVDGEFSHLSGSTDIDVSDIDVMYCDLQHFDAKAAAGLTMEPLLGAVYSQATAIDGPMMIAFDEFHYMLMNSSTMEPLKQVYRHSRHSNLSILTGTQTVEEFFTKNDEGQKQLTNSSKELIDLMSVKIWHFLKNMNDEWADILGFTEREQKYISDADTGDPTAQALLEVDKEGSFPLDVKFDHELNPREFAVNQYDPTAEDHDKDFLKYLDDYTDENGHDVCEWTWTTPNGAPDGGERQ